MEEKKKCCPLTGCDCGFGPTSWRNSWNRWEVSNYNLFFALIFLLSSRRFVNRAQVYTNELREIEKPLLSVWMCVWVCWREWAWSSKLEGFPRLRVYWLCLFSVRFCWFLLDSFFLAGGCVLSLVVFVSWSRHGLDATFYDSSEKLWCVWVRSV